MLHESSGPREVEYTSIRTPSRSPSARPRPVPEDVARRIHDRVYRYLYKHPGFLQPFETYTRNVHRIVLETAEPINLTQYPRTREIEDADPFVTFESETASSTSTVERQTEYTLAWDRPKLSVEGKALVKAMEMALANPPAVYPALLGATLPDPFPLHLRPLEPILTRRELNTSASLSTKRELLAPSRLSQLFEKEGEFAIGEPLEIENVEDSPFDEAQALNMGLQANDQIKRSAKVWRERLIGSLHGMIKRRKPLGQELQWDKWKQEDDTKLAAAPTFLSPPLFPRRDRTHIATKPLNYNHLRLYSLREDAGPASPALQKLINQPREITLKTLAETLRASNIIDEEEKWRLSDPLRLNLLDDFDDMPLESLTPTSVGSRTPSSGYTDPILDVQTCLTPSRRTQLVEEYGGTQYYPTPFDHRRHRAAAHRQRTQTGQHHFRWAPGGRTRVPSPHERSNHPQDFDADPPDQIGRRQQVPYPPQEPSAPTQNIGRHFGHILPPADPLGSLPYAQISHQTPEYPYDQEEERSSKEQGGCQTHYGGGNHAGHSGADQRTAADPRQGNNSCPEGYEPDYEGDENSAYSDATMRQGDREDDGVDTAPAEANGLTGQDYPNLQPQYSAPESGWCDHLDSESVWWAADTERTEVDLEHDRKGLDGDHAPDEPPQSDDNGMLADRDEPVEPPCTEVWPEQADDDEAYDEAYDATPEATYDVPYDGTTCGAWHHDEETKYEAKVDGDVDRPMSPTIQQSPVRHDGYERPSASVYTEWGWSPAQRRAADLDGHAASSYSSPAITGQSKWPEADDEWEHQCDDPHDDYTAQHINPDGSGPGIAPEEHYESENNQATTAEDHGIYPDPSDQEWYVETEHEYAVEHALDPQADVGLVSAMDARTYDDSQACSPSASHDFGTEYEQREEDERSRRGYPHEYEQAYDQTYDQIYDYTYEQAYDPTSEYRDEEDVGRKTGPDDYQLYAKGYDQECGQDDDTGETAFDAMDTDTGHGEDQARWGCEWIEPAVRDLNNYDTPDRSNGQRGLGLPLAVDTSRSQEDQHENRAHSFGDEYEFGREERLACCGERGGDLTGQTGSHYDSRCDLTESVSDPLNAAVTDQQTVQCLQHRSGEHRPEDTWSAAWAPDTSMLRFTGHRSLSPADSTSEFRRETVSGSSRLTQGQQVAPTLPEAKSNIEAAQQPPSRRQPASRHVKKRKADQFQVSLPQSFEARCAASNRTSTELERIARPVKRPKSDSGPQAGGSTLDDIIRAQQPASEGAVARTDGNDAGKQAREFFAALDLQVSSPPPMPSGSLIPDEIKPKSTTQSVERAAREVVNWRSDPALCNSAWWKSLALNAQDDLGKIPVLVDISVTRNRSLARAFAKVFDLVEKSIETRAGSEEAAKLGSAMLRYGWLQGADMVLSAATAVVFYRIDAITTSLTDIVSRLAATARHYRRVLVIFEVADYHARLQAKEEEEHVGTLPAGLSQAVPKLRRAMSVSLADLEMPAHLELIFAYDGPEQLAQVLRACVEEEFVDLKKSYGDARVFDACEGREEWILRDESEQCVLTGVSLDLNAFACGYVLHKASTIDAFIFDCTAEDRVKLVEHVLGEQQMVGHGYEPGENRDDAQARVNQLIAERLKNVDLSSEA